MVNIAHQDAGDPNQRPALSNRRWMPGVLAVLVLVGGFGLGALYASVASVDPEPPPTEPQGIAAESPLAAPAGESSSAAEMAVAQSAVSGRELGPTEVAFVANFPLMDFDWEVVNVPIEGDLEFRWFGRIGGKYTVVGLMHSDAGASQVLTTLISDDGRAWTEAGTFALPEQTSLQEVTGSGGRLLAVGETWNDGLSASRLIYVSADGIRWTEFSVPELADGSEYSYVQGIAANSAGIILTVTIESYPPEPPQRIQIRGFVVEIDHRSGSYALTDPAGAVVLTGSTNDIWHWQDHGQGIYDPETGDLITTVPWQTWEQGWSASEGRFSGSPLPVPIEPTEPYVSPIFEVEWDGLVITVDEAEGLYEVRDAESGAVIASGPADYIWRGPPPSFLDSQTGEPILSVTWAEWDEAEMSSWENQEQAEYGEGWYHTETVVLFSADGNDWDESTISSSSSGSSVSVMATDEEFVLDVISYGPYGESRSVWTSGDGLAWAVAESAEVGERYLHSTVATSDGFRSIGDGPGGQGVWSSSDGVSWETAFTIGPQDDGQYVWLSTMAHGSLGTVAAGTRENVYEYSPLTVTKAGLTAEFEGEFVVRITDDSTGDELLLLTWEDFDSGAVGDQIAHEDDETRFFNSSGNLVMAITDEEAKEAVGIREEQFQSARRQVMFIEVDGEWFEVEVDAEGVDYVSGLVVGDAEVLLAAMDWDDSYTWEDEFGGGASSVVILIGTPAE